MIINKENIKQYIIYHNYSLNYKYIDNLIILELFNKYKFTYVIDKEYIIVNMLGISSFISIKSYNKYSTKIRKEKINKIFKCNI